MSYDIQFKAKVENTNECVHVGGTANITWNVRELIEKSSGWDIQNEDFNGLVKDLIPKIQHGLNELCQNPRKYTKYESPNGWGTIGGVINFYRTILKDWEDLQDYYAEIPQVALVYVG
jgi:hypothetical protein